MLRFTRAFQGVAVVTAMAWVVGPIPSYAASEMKASARETLVPVHVCVSHWQEEAMAGSLVVAKARGLFEKNGLKPIFHYLEEPDETSANGSGDRGDQELIKKLQAGNGCDVGAAFVSSLLRSNADLVKISPVGFYRYGFGYDTKLVVSKKSKIQKIADLKGARIRVGPMLSRLALERVLASGGLSLADVTIVDKAPFRISHLLERGVLDAAIAYNPTMALLLAEGNVRPIETDLITKTFSVPVPQSALLARASLPESTMKKMNGLMADIGKILQADPTVLVEAFEALAKERGDKYSGWGLSDSVVQRSSQLMGDLKIFNIGEKIPTGKGDSVSVYDALVAFQSEMKRSNVLVEGHGVDLRVWRNKM